MFKPTGTDPGHSQVHLCSALVPTRHWNNISAYTAIINGTIGSELLALAEFAYNNAPSATTGISPFFANKEYRLNITVHPEHDLSSARAREFAVNLDDLHQELRLQIAEAQKCYQGPADTRRTPAPDFKVRDKVFIKAAH